MATKEKIDKFLSRVISRKLLVLIIATFALFMAVLQPVDWIIVASVYIGSQAAVDIVERLKK